MKRIEKLQDLLDEAKRRTILLAIFISVIAYLLSLTSSSFWFNIPIATLILAVLRYLSFELEIRKREQELSFPSHLLHLLKRQISADDPLLCSPPVSAKWRRKIDSPIVEAAVDELTCRIVQEFMTDLWYSSFTPDQDALEQLRVLINDVIGEISQRVKRINLINLLTRDVVDLVGNHLDLFRQAKATIGPKRLVILSSEEREEKLKQAFMDKKQLHPALLSVEGEYKVLQQLMSGVVSSLLRTQDIQCPLMRCLARELLACAVIRPIMDLARPSVINGVIEEAMLLFKENGQNKKPERVEADEGLNGKFSKGSITRFSGSKDNLPSGFEVMPAGSAFGQGPLRAGASKYLEAEQLEFSKTAVLSHRVPYVSSTQERNSVVHSGQEDWAQVLDAFNRQRTRILAPENLDNLWAKGRNYRKKELQKAMAKSSQTGSQLRSQTNDVMQSSSFDKQGVTLPRKDFYAQDGFSNAHVLSHIGETAESLSVESVGSRKATRRSLELPKSVTGPVLSSQTLDQSASLVSEGTSSWVQGFGPCEVKKTVPNDSRTAELQVSRHPLEFCMEDSPPKYEEQEMHTSSVSPPHQQGSRISSTGLDGWQKLEKSSIDQDNSVYYWNAPGLQKSSGGRQVDQLTRWLSDPPEVIGKGLSSQTDASKINCRVVRAHLEKAGSKCFAVYTIAVIDSDNKTWFVERRFRNFEQLHRRLRDLPQYNLHLPPKRFLASSLDDAFVRDRCILLNKYLKDLMSVPSISESHEVWDFLSVTSKNYALGKSPSVMKTLAVNVDDAMDDMLRQLRGVSDGIIQRVSGPSLTSPDSVSTTTSDSVAKLANPPETVFNEMLWGGSGTSGNLSDNGYGGLSGVAQEKSADFVKDEEWHSDSELQVQRHTSGASPQSRKLEIEKNDLHPKRRIKRLGFDPLSLEESMAGSDIFDDEMEVPPEWTPPKLSVPLLNLVDGVFQLQGRGWIRRQVFWMAKQVLQLGMGDAIDDWLVAQIQWLRREDVVASAFKWVQEVLWPDVKVQQASSVERTLGSPNNQAFQRGTDQSAFFEQQLEATRRASVVHEIIVDGAPAALVSLIGKKQYTRCANDIYYFLQSTVCLKQLAYSLLECLLTATFPELNAFILTVRNTSH